MKKAIIYVMTFLILLLSASFTANAENVTTLTVDSVKATQNSTVGVTINLKNNQGIWGMVFNVRFDTKYFSVAEVRNDADAFQLGEMMVGPNDFSGGYVRVLITPNDINNNNTKNGKICTVYFNVLKDTANGDYPITLDIDENDFCDVKAQTVKVQTENGSIDVNEDYKAPTTKKTKTAEEVVATTAKNGSTGKNIETDENNIENETEIQTVNKTDKNGETVTNQKGETVTEKVIVDKKSGEVIGSVSQETETENDSAKNIIFIIIACVLMAGIIVYAFVIFKKKKVK